MRLRHIPILLCLALSEHASAWVACMPICNGCMAADISGTASTSSSKLTTGSAKGQGLDMAVQTAEDTLKSSVSAAMDEYEASWLLTRTELNGATDKLVVAMTESTKAVQSATTTRMTALQQAFKDVAIVERQKEVADNLGINAQPAIGQSLTVGSEGFYIGKDTTEAMAKISGKATPAAVIKGNYAEKQDKLDELLNSIERATERLSTSSGSSDQYAGDLDVWKMIIGDLYRVDPAIRNESKTKLTTFSQNARQLLTSEIAGRAISDKAPVLAIPKGDIHIDAFATAMKWSGDENHHKISAAEWIDFLSRSFLLDSDLALNNKLTNEIGNLRNQLYKEAQKNFVLMSELERKRYRVKLLALSVAGQLDR